MRKFSSFLALVVCFVAISEIVAADGDTTKPIREIFVPFDDLNVLLQGDAERAFLTREEYEELIEKAKQTPLEHAPHKVLLLSADYETTIEDGRASIKGKLWIDVLEPGLHALPLDLSGVGVRSASLDNKAASLGRGQGGRIILFVEGTGKRELTLDLVTVLRTSAAQQSLQFALPTPAATKLHVTVPGNVEVRSGAAVVSRQVDQEANVTRFELLPSRGPLSLVMSLNNKLLLEKRVVMARSVIVDEMTQAYERLHATVSLEVLHGAVDQFSFRVPQGFEITDVTSPALARWLVREDDDSETLTVHLREPTTGTIVLNVAGINNQVDFEGWSMPRLVPLDVNNHVAVVGMLIEDRLAAEGLVATNLIAIDNDVLRKALPESVFNVDPGAPKVRPVAAFYAPQDQYKLTARFTLPPPRIDARITMLLTLGEKEQRALGTIALTPSNEKLFTFDITVPTEWRVLAIKGRSGTPIPFEKISNGDGEPTRLHVKLPKGVVPGAEAFLTLEATSVPDGWLDEWSNANTQFPVFAINGIATTAGAIVVESQDDLTARPDEVSGLATLSDSERKALGLKISEGTLAYRIEDQTYAGSFTIERMQPRMMARTFNFLKVEPEGLKAHYEIAFNVARARTRKLSFVLPSDTPSALSVKGLDSTKVKEYSSELVDGQRIWTAELAAPTIGQVRLAIEFEQPLSEDEPQNWKLPLVRASNVAYQSATVAVEGSAEFDAQLESNGRKIDVGELVDAEYQVGKRLLGAFGFIGEPEVTIDIFQREGYGLPTAITQRAELVTLVAASGSSQTAARYLLRTKASFLQIRLPDNATLWSASVDGKPATPQRDGRDLVISLPPSTQEALRDLQIVYESDVLPVDWMSNVESDAPRLVVRNDTGDAGYEVPTADVVWHLVLPEGHRIVRSNGTVFTDRLSRQKSSATFLAKLLYQLSGGIGRFGVGPSMVLSSREPSVSSARYAMESAAMDSEGVEFEQLAESPAPMSALPEEEAAAENDFSTNDMDGAITADAPTVSTLQDIENAPQAEAAQATGVTKAITRGKQIWALQGVRSLKIELERAGQQVTFTSMGVRPRLHATLVNSDRISFVGWTLAVVTFVFGFAQTNRCVRTKTRYVVNACVIAFALPLVIGLFSDIEVTELFAPMLFVAVMLIPYYIAAGVVKWIAAKIRSFQANPAATTATAAVAFILFTNATLTTEVTAQEANGNPTIDASELLLLLQDKPVQLPKDAVIIPYDPSDKDGVENAEKVLVPYAEYTRLWNLAFPDKPIGGDVKPPAAYAFSNSSYTAILMDAEYLLVRGQMTLDVYQKSPIDIPLHLAGGVLESATVDGEPARLRIIASSEATPNQAPKAATKQQTKALPQAVPQSKAFATLLIAEPGAKVLELAIRLPISRRGGWRIAQGRLPDAPATKLAIQVPAEKTELRLSGTLDRTAFETKVANEVIDTALPAGGVFSLQWRPAIAAGQVDQTLTARSSGVFDVQEDGLRLAWQIALQTRNNQRETFTFSVPKDYLVERIFGDNIRGWQTRPSGDEQRVDVTLLKAAVGTETINLRLSRRSVVGLDGQSTVSVPSIVVPDAILHQGEIAIRRSPLMDVRTESTNGLSRIEVVDDALANVLGSDVEESPLGLKSFEAYRFGASTFQLQLLAEAHQSRLSVEQQTVLRIGERVSHVESRLKCAVETRPIFKLEVELPTNFELTEVVAPGTFDWAITTDEDGQLLSIYLAAGAIGSIDIDLRGTSPREAGAAVTGPRFVVRNADRQSGAIVVQVDPSIDVAVEESENVELVSLGRVSSWLAVAQRRVARLAVAFESADFNASFQTMVRQAQVNSMSVTNVRVTQREIEELIFLKFRVRRAGIREVSFLLPASLSDSQITVPLLRQKTIEPVENDPSKVRVHLELQDEVIDELIVLVENSRPLQTGQYDAPLPTIETGTTDFRYVVIESAGRDEVVVARSDGLLELNRQLSQWKQLTQILPGNITRAYVVESRNATAEPRLSIETRQRDRVETVGASIGIAQTLLLVDANGAYRGIQEYRVDNKTEQFLEIKLPQDAVLWTVLVAGEPVKPTVVPNAPTKQHVRIPLIKTQTGDLDYAVVLKYGGDLDRLRTLRTISFPLVRTTNINVEQSHVRLRLPETQKWMNFAGSMRHVTDPGELAADYVSYQTKQMQRLLQVVNSDSYSSFSKLRAENNIKLQVRESVTNSPALLGDLYGRSSNERLQREIVSNQGVVQEAEKQIQQNAQAQPEAHYFGNSFRLKELYNDQATNRASNVVSGLEYNFDVSGPQQEQAQVVDSEQKFNSKWFDGNKLQQKSKKLAKEAESRIAAKPGKAEAAKDNLRFDADFLRDNRQQIETFDKKQLSDEVSQLRRYQERLELQNDSQQQPGRYAQAVPQSASESNRYREFSYEQMPRGQALGEGESAFGGMLGGDGGFGGGGAAVSGGTRRQLAMAGEENAEAIAVASAGSGLTSLDVALPERGAEFFFTTPRGDLEITAQAVPIKQINRGAGLLGILAVLIAMAVIYRIGQAVVARVSEQVISWTMIVLGLLSFVVGIFPVVGIGLMVWGIARVIRRAASGQSAQIAS